MINTSPSVGKQPNMPGASSGAMKENELG